MRFWNMILQWFYPPHCILCGKIMKTGTKEILCSECKNTLPWKEGAVCQKCGRSVYLNETYCERCQKANFVFEKGVAVFSYADVRDAIAHFKFKYWKRDAVPLAKLMGDYLLTYYPELQEQSDLLIPVPMYEKKQKVRGFNQSELLAKLLAERFGKPYSANNLKRIRHTAPQSLLNAEQRRENIKGAFSLENGEEVEGKTILLIDDIFTTGTTINECSKVLYANGAKRVLFFGLSVAEN